jgi:peptidoglycan hydrolase CwlO-like protein
MIVRHDDEHEDYAELEAVARQIGQSQRDESNRAIRRSILAVIVIILLFGFISLGILAKLLDDIEAQTDALDQSVADARVAQAREQEQLERILAGIEARLIPREDIVQLQAEVEELQGDVEALQKTNRQLTAAVNELTRVTQQALQRQPGGG